jgi:O-succinylbenzoic acid--CoA ligase
MHPEFQIDGHGYDAFLAKTGLQGEAEIAQNLIRQWAEGDETFAFFSSGATTGKPKTLEFSRTQIIDSCIATQRFLQLKPRDTALLALPLGFTGGRMMLFRALVCGFRLHLIAPTSVITPPFSIDFAALTPMQVEASCAQTAFTRIRKLIVGGARVAPPLEKRLSGLKTEAYETFGMTETLSHVALRRLGHTDKFEALPGITFSVDAADCLCIHSPVIGDTALSTRDVVEWLSPTEFRWKGRADYLINTGGIKVFPEEIERKLSGLISVPFYITSTPDDRLGQAVTLVYESETELTEWPFDALNPFEKPRILKRISAFRRTTAGKIIRQQ